MTNIGTRSMSTDSASGHTARPALLREATVQCNLACLSAPWHIVPMSNPKNRAAVVSLRGDRLLAIRRTKQGRSYAVLPGGGIEPNESAQDAALRELIEETGLPGRVLRHLWTMSTMTGLPITSLSPFRWRRW